jgi:hypothetical protein
LPCRRRARIIAAMDAGRLSATSILDCAVLASACSDVSRVGWEAVRMAASEDRAIPMKVAR